LLAGNIGIPASDVAIKARQDQIITMELSSFQLMDIQRFHPHIAVLTNIYEAHLDYHESRQAYITAKMRITENQTSDDFFVVNSNQSEILSTEMAFKGFEKPIILLADGLDRGIEFSPLKPHLKKYSIW
jgi:UDP-N-acetylmuramoylalanine--D-glutamate ligase